MKSEIRASRASRYLEELNKGSFTTRPVVAGNCTDVAPEFGRWQDVQRIYGIKRGTLYNLMAEGRVRSIILRRKGNIHGCRLFHLRSISDYLYKLMEEQDGKSASEEIG